MSETMVVRLPGPNGADWEYTVTGPTRVAVLAAAAKLASTRMPQPLEVQMQAAAATVVRRLVPGGSV